MQLRNALAMAAAVLLTTPRPVALLRPPGGDTDAHVGRTTTHGRGAGRGIIGTTATATAVSGSTAAAHEDGFHSPKDMPTSSVCRLNQLAMEYAHKIQPRRPHSWNVATLADCPTAIGSSNVSNKHKHMAVTRVYADCLRADGYTLQWPAWFAATGVAFEH